MTKQEVFKLLAMIETVYPLCITKDETVSHWFELCSQLDFEKVMGKLRNHIRKSPYPPAIADIAGFPSIYEQEEDSYKKISWLKEYTLK